MEGYEVLPNERRHHWLAARLAVMFAPAAGLVVVTLLGVVPRDTWSAGYWAVQGAYLVGVVAAILAALFWIGTEAKLILGDGGLIIETGFRNLGGRTAAPRSSVALRGDVAYVFVGPHGPPIRILLSPRQAVRVKARMRLPLPD